MPTPRTSIGDVLRGEGEAYVRQLTESGVHTTSVRYHGIIHAFMMLNPVREQPP